MAPALALVGSGLVLRWSRAADASARRSGAILVVIGAAVFAFCAWLVLFVGAQPI